MNTWWTIGKYGMRLNLGKAYRQRTLYVPLIGAAYALFAFAFAWFVRENPDNVVLRFLEDRVLFATLMDLVLLYLFVYLIIIHVFTGIRKENKASIELLLSAPLRSEDIVMGETIAMVPVYLLILPFVLIPLFVLGGIQAGLDALGMVRILVSQVLMFVIAIGVGAIVLSLVQSSIQRIKFNKYFRLIATFVGAGLYLSIYGLNAWLSTAEALTQHPVLSYLPHALSGNVIYAEILGATVTPSVSSSIAFLAVWVVIIYRIGIRIAGRAYSLEKEMAVGKTTVAREGVLIKMVRAILPSSQKEKVVTHFKLFFRDSYNFANSMYLIIIGYFIIAFTLWSSRGTEESLLPIFTFEVLITPMFVAIFLMSMFYLSRDALWIWKKAPGGVEAFVKSKWLQTFILSFVFVPVPLVAWLTVARAYLPVGYALSLAVWVIPLNSFAASFGILVNVYNPSQSIKGAKMAINALISTFSLLFILYASLLGALYIGVLPDEPTVLEHLGVGLLIGAILNIFGWLMYKAACRRIETNMD